tara:strand:- start:473 stop:964 length:492 start_codon:yes stop_codon:yes gene_type:complete
MLFIIIIQKVVAKTVMRSMSSYDATTRSSWDEICTWENTWHGTKSKCVKSILTTGLRAAGSKSSDGSTLKPPSGHYKLGDTHFGIADWAAAIFVSPSLLYASHPAYSESIFGVSAGGEDDGRERWKVCIMTKVKPETFTKHDPTTYVLYEYHECDSCFVFFIC